MITDPHLDLAEAVEKARSGDELQICCKSHGDTTPSLSVSYSPGKGVLLHCFAGCETKDVLAAEGLTWADLFDPDDNLAPDDRNSWTPAGQASHIYPYIDEQGSVLYEVLRVPQPGGAKTFFQRQWDQVQDKYVWNMKGVRRVLYQLPEVINAVTNGESIFLTEGEKDADTVRRMGLKATTNAMGAGKWDEGYTEILAGATVVILSDADSAGRAHTRMVRDHLVGAGCRVEIREPKGDFKDITEMHQRGGGGIEDMMVVVPFQDAERIKFGFDVLDVILRPASITEFVIPGTMAKRERLIVTGFEGHGKALALDTAIPSPDGWTTMEKLDVGDRVFATDGSIVHVLATSEVMHGRPCYKLTFSDGSTVVADADHLWITETLASREAAARARRGSKITDKHIPREATTEQIASSLHARDGHCVNHSIHVAGALQYPERDLPVAPYTLGAWLGDGHSASARITTHTDDVEIIDNIRADGWTVTKQSGEYLWAITSDKRWNNSLQSVLRHMGVLNDKHIPAAYLSAGIDQRLALLQGLMDTDGSVDRRGDCELTLTNRALAADAHELIVGLGIKVSFIIDRASLNGRDAGERYRLLFRTDVPVFRLVRKVARLTLRTTARHLLRYIVSVEKVDTVPVKCIRVAHDSETYLITRSCIPTHNSTLLRQIAVQVAAGIHPWTLAEIEPKRVLMIDAENEPGQVRSSWQDLVGLAAYHDHPIERDQLIVLEEWDNEIDLSDKHWHEWLHERIYGYQPELVILGPLTNLVARDLKDDEPVRKLKSAVNTGRTICDSAFIMEHHAPHRNPSDKRRSVRPYGSSMFLKWPDYGYGLNPDPDREGYYQWERTRWPRVRTRIWPDTLRWGKPGPGGEWPWQEAEPA